jgi:hypothetical protein
MPIVVSGVDMKKFLMTHFVSSVLNMIEEDEVPLSLLYNR